MRHEGQVGIPLELKQGNRLSLRDEVGNKMPFSSSARKLGFPLQLRWGPQGMSCVASGRSSLLVEGWERKIALKLLQEHLASSHIEEGISWCFSSCGGKHCIPVELRRGPQGTPHVASAKSGHLSSCKGYRGIPLKSLQGNSSSSQVEAGSSGFLSSCHRDFSVPFKFQRGNSRFISRHCRVIWPHLTLR